ncbi:hypothetical protein D3C80_1597760 [compost metagenome]
MRPSRALWVRLMVYWSSAGVLPLALPAAATGVAGLARGLASFDSALPSTSAAKLSRRWSALILSSSGAEAITTRRSSASLSRACSRWPVRICPWPNSIEASIQACSIIRVMCGDSAGVRVLPFLKVPSAVTSCACKRSATTS